jgi:two-component system sensor histidine kinase/response regulator
MNGHVAKPVDPSDLYQALLEAIPTADYSANLPAGSGGADTVTSEQPDPLPASMPGLAIGEALGRLANNEKLYLQLVGELIDDYSGAPETIRQLASIGDSDQLRAVAHKIRGIANNLGASELGAGAESIEMTAIAGEAVTEPQTESLEQSLQLVRQSYSELLENRQPECMSRDPIVIDSLAVLASLRTAVASADPGASDLVDQLLAAHRDRGDLAGRLAQARELLDNFNFSDAEPLLASIEEDLKT